MAADSQAAKAWISRLHSTSFATGGQLIRYLVDDRAPGGLMRYEGGPTADALLRWWEQEGLIVCGEISDLTPEQRINCTQPSSYPSCYGWGIGPSLGSPEYAAPPEDQSLPAWRRAERERAHLTHLDGSTDEEGYRVYICVGGGPLGRPAYPTDTTGSGSCPSCHEVHPLRAGGRQVVYHLTRDYSIPRLQREV